MNTLRRPILFILSMVLSFLLLAFATVYAAGNTAGDAGYIKQSLAETNFYDRIIDNVIKSATASQNNAAQSQEITKLTPTINKILTPETLQSNTENLIDGFDNWLKGKSPTPDFSLDLTQARSKLVVELSSYLQTKNGGLPVCSNPKDLENYDPVSAECRPPVALSQADYEAQVKKMLDTMPMLKDDKITFEDIDMAGKSGQNSFMQNAPIAGRWLSRMPVILTILILITAGLILFVSRETFKGLRIVGHALVSTGVLCLVAGALLTYLLTRNFNSIFAGADSAQAILAQETILPVLKKLVQGISTYQMYTGATYAAMGAVLYVTSHILHNRQKLKKTAVAEASAFSPTTNETPETHTTPADKAEKQK